ncbi:probable 1-acylglycerol-3-phosphate O-acyltransferase [Lolium rigidum]|uniref:probable 1-acylglycerol-3-phosphate O-acyltransferase n=1 Tax=Lolium rigidum TaxID=89674 RepID=UPI001F5C6016|nr:probable 1-acylglycerol-3-phosphate O-acyltransferase [Lolium rigidum]
MRRAAAVTRRMASAVGTREASTAAAPAEAAAASSSAPRPAGSSWRRALRWMPTSTDHIVASEKRLLSTLKTGYVQEQINIGPAPPTPGLKPRTSRDEPRFINTVTFDSKEDAPTLVLVHGFGASQGLFFRNFDALAKRFRVIAIDQLGWGGSSRPKFTCKNTEETEAWFVDSFEEWRKAKNLSNFILLGHSFGGYVVARYALKHPEHVQHLILVGPVGFSPEADPTAESLTKFRAKLAHHLWEYNFTAQKVVRGLGPCGPALVRAYTTARFGSFPTGESLTKQESSYLTDYIYHTIVAKASGELCQKYLFYMGPFTRKSLLQSAPDWKVPTTFIYGQDDWVDYQLAQQACKDMKIPYEIIRVPQAGHFAFMDNPSAFESAVFYASRDFLSRDSEEALSLPDGLTFA